MAKRPFFSTRIDQLEVLARSPETSARILRQIHGELRYRSTFRAQRLQKELDRRATQSASLSQTQAGSSPIAAPTPSAIRLDEAAYPADPILCPSNSSGLSIATLGLSVRANNVCSKMGIRTLGDVTQSSSVDFLKSRNCGKTTLREIQTRLAERGLALHDEVTAIEPPPEIRVEHLSARLIMLGLSARARSFFQRRGLTYVGELCQLSESEVWKASSVGRTTLHELKKALASLGLRFGLDVSPWTPAAAEDISREASLPAGFRPPEPPTLMEALQMRLQRVASSERNVRWTLEHLGWDGTPGRTLESIGQRDKVSRERVRQVAAKCCRALRERQFPPRSLRQAIALLRSNVPLAQSRFDQLMKERGLASGPFHIEGIRRAADVFGLRFPFAVRDRGSDPLILPRALSDMPDQLLRATRREVGTRGCVVDDQLMEFGLEIGGPRIDLQLIHSVLEREGSFARLSGAEAWWWRPEKARSGRNRLVNTIRKVVAASSPIALQELRDAARRHVRSNHVAPPTTVLRALCESLPFLRVVDSHVERLDEAIDWSSVLNDSEKALITIFEHCGPVVHSYKFSEEGMALGMNENSLSIYKSYSPLLWTPVPGYYSLVGSDIPLGLIEDVQARSPSSTRAFIESGWTADMHVFLCYRITQSIWHSGQLNVPASVRSVLQGSYQVLALGKQQIGAADVRNSTISSLRKFFRIFGAEEGDTLLLEFDVRKRVCEAWLGGAEMANAIEQGKAADVFEELRALPVGIVGSDDEEEL